MERCKGTTRAGERCKRSADEGSDYCGMHADQAEPAGVAESSGRARVGKAAGERGADLVLVGAVAVALWAVRRVLRFL